MGWVSNVHCELLESRINVTSNGEKDFLIKIVRRGTRLGGTSFFAGYRRFDSSLPWSKRHHMLAAFYYRMKKMEQVGTHDDARMIGEQQKDESSFLR